MIHDLKDALQDALIHDFMIDLKKHALTHFDPCTLKHELHTYFETCFKKCWENALKHALKEAMKHALRSVLNGALKNALVEKRL